jgi:hypothetical protein
MIESWRVSGIIFKRLKNFQFMQIDLNHATREFGGYNNQGPNRSLEKDIGFWRIYLHSLLSL